ncbi:MAG: M28 family peptidase [Ignavibacteria bacterium]|nr:M28 family peptidase [Ignavibacteria bacterium]
MKLPCAGLAARVRILVLCLLLIAPVVIAQKKSRIPAKPSPLRVTPELLRPHLRFLASDELQGRETGEHGQKVAAQYLAAMFERAGVQPAGDSGSYLQRFSLYREAANGVQRISLRDADSETPLDITDDFVFTVFGSDTIDAPVVFAGYGIDDSLNFRYSDYAGIDVAGKVVLIIGGVPRRNDPAAPFSTARNRWQDMSAATPSLAKIAAARAAGARALLIVPDIGESGLGNITKKVKRRSPFSFLSFSPPRRTVSAMPVAFVSARVAARILGGGPVTVQTLKKHIDSALTPASFEIPSARLSIVTARTIDTVRTENVVGIVAGSDSVLKREAVVFSAHYDHIGMHADGTVYNGADDDASGTSAVLAFAELLGTLPVKPKRSVVLLCNTGEENGLLGSEYYARNPVIPLSNTVCNVNIDMIGRRDPAHVLSGVSDYVYVIGSKRRSAELDDVLQRVNRETDNLVLDYAYDAPDDPERLYERSDHYNFAKRGIPVIFFHTGEHEDYHRSTDDFEKIEFDRMARVATLVLRVGLSVASRPQRLRITEPLELDP